MSISLARKTLLHDWRRFTAAIAALSQTMSEWRRGKIKQIATVVSAVSQAGSAASLAGFSPSCSRRCASRGRWSSTGSMPRSSITTGKVIRIAQVFGAKRASDDPNEKTDERVVEVVTSLDNPSFLIGQRVRVDFKDAS